MTIFTTPRLLKSAVAAGALLSLGGCMYGGGAYGDGYVNNRGYDCDPYAPFDDYYACDYGYGFANIGYGGGWYDQYYYPGYGIYIFDRGGRRLAMRDNHRRYWARQRAAYGGHHARDRSDQRYDRRDGSRNPSRDNTRSQQRGDERDNRGARNERGDRREPGATRPNRTDRTDRAAPTRSRGDQAGRPNRRPARAVEQPQSRPQPAARADRATRPPRSEPARNSRENTGNGRKPLNDD